MSESKIDFYNETARRCHGKPEGWRWFRMNSHEAPPGYFQLTGCVPVGVYRSGPRKGRTKWNLKSAETIWMQENEVKETQRLWGVETGKCSTCRGTGEVFKSWSVVNGEVLQECNVCKGSGAFQS